MYNRLAKGLTVASWMLVALLWVVTLIMMAKLPDVIPVHFNLNNEADNFGSKTMLWMFPVIATILVGLFAAIKKHPEYLNYPVKITEENRERQQQLALTLLSAIAVVIPSLFIFVIYSTARYVEAGSFHFPLALVLGWVLLPIIVYFYFAYKAR
jgi:uncharacterized membrane protein